MEAAVLFMSCWGKNVFSFNGSKLVVQITRNPCKPWHLAAKISLVFYGKILPWQTNKILTIL